MTNSTKAKVGAAAGVAVIALVCIFGGRYLADRVADDKAAQLAAQREQDLAADSTPAGRSQIADAAPIDSATVFDENGNVAIIPNAEDAALEAVNHASAAVPETTPQAAADSTTQAAADKPAQLQQPATSETQTQPVQTTAKPKTDTQTGSKPQTDPQPKTDTQTEPKPKTDTEQPKADPKPENPAPAPDPEPTPEPKPSGGGNSHEGMIYVEGFGWIESSGSEFEQSVDQGGDYNKIVGSMD